MATAELNPGGATDLADAIRQRYEGEANAYAYPLTPTRKTKLDGIASGATANSSDATLLARANHTGTQLASTVSDFSEAVDDRVAALLVAGDNIALTYNDAGNALTVALTGRDVIWARLAADYTLTNTASAQKMLDTSISPNGRATLSSGLWEVIAHVHITNMDATSGNATFTLAAGTATLSAVSLHATGLDSSTPTQAAAQSGQYAASLAVQMAGNGTGTGLTCRVKGLFRVTGAGTVEPQITLANAAAATLKSQSFVLFQRLGDDAVSAGTWS